MLTPSGEPDATVRDYRGQTCRTGIRPPETMGSSASSQHRYRVLLATDGSLASEWAHRWVARVRWAEQPTVDVLTVADSTVLQPAWLPATLDHQLVELTGVLREEAEAEAASIAETTATRLRREGLTVTATSTYGLPAVRLLEHIAESTPALVALGHRGQSDVDAMLLGSVTHEVARYSPSPALVARAPTDDGSQLPRRVLVVVDPLTRAQPAVAWLRRHGWLAGAEVILMGMLGPSPGLLPGPQSLARTISSQCRDHATSVIERAASELQVVASEVTSVVRAGHPLDACASVAASSRADLVVLCRPAHDPGRYPLAEKLTRYIDTSVLLVPADRSAPNRPGGGPNHPFG
ncbi:MAG: universal stress protein [Candidatus Limnocylindrales bacterium]